LNSPEIDGARSIGPAYQVKPPNLQHFHIENPYYQQTDKESNPHGYNSLGTKYVDYGLGANPNPAPDGTRSYKNFAGDIDRPMGLTGPELTC